MAIQWYLQSWEISFGNACVIIVCFSNKPLLWHFLSSCDEPKCGPVVSLELGKGSGWDCPCLHVRVLTEEPWLTQLACGALGFSLTVLVCVWPCLSVCSDLWPWLPDESCKVCAGGLWWQCRRQRVQRCSKAQRQPGKRKLLWIKIDYVFIKSCPPPPEFSVLFVLIPNNLN